MAETRLQSLTGAQLFQLCAAHFSDSAYWEEFVSRYNKILVRGVYHGYRRFGRQVPLREAVADVLQDVYTEIIKEQCASLQRFRGQTEMEAQAYLVQLAANITSNYLRRTAALKRHALTEQLDELSWLDEDAGLSVTRPGDYTDALADRELIQLLRRRLTGEHVRRDILLYLLHVREGMTITELASAGSCDLKPSSIAQIIRRIRAELKNVYWLDLIYFGVLSLVHLSCWNLPAS